MTIEEMKKRKQEMGYSNGRLSELSGVPVGTLQKIFSGETTSPRYDTVRALAEVLSSIPDEVREPALVHNRNLRSNSLNSTPNDFSEGGKTIDDYLALPEGARVELIDGKFYEMAAPTTIHQRIGLILGSLLSNHIAKNGGMCVPFLAPTDVQLDCDEKTMMQPDVLVVCDRNKITRPRIVGAPDLVIEIISPSNAVTDALIKLSKYQKAGVREYWIVFPDEKQIIVYDFENDATLKIYTFEDEIPVGIWNGACKIDFKSIYAQIEFMY